MKPWTYATLLAALVAFDASGADLGMDAPPLKIKDWVQGKAVDLAAAKGKQVVVVEFWATWCGPCRATIPHLSELYGRFKDKDVLVVGVSDEPAAKVKPFVEKMADKMTYVVAADDARKTSAAYMEAFGVNGIPHAFVVDKQGRIAWHGHPMAGLDEALADIVAGQYDIESAKRSLRAEKSMQEYFGMVADGTHTPKSKEMGETILKDASSNAGLLNQFAWILLTHPRLKNPDRDLAVRAAKAAYDTSEGKDPSVIDTYARAQFVQGKVAEAVVLQKKAIELCDDADLKKKLEKTLEEYQAKTP
ncbi:MAG: redoxin domain-containing protein [Verrucomicrobiales bacterium]|nr:redoxin domain-containing protein [Verrucomicrobiales bacterium]